MAYLVCANKSRYVIYADRKPGRIYLNILMKEVGAVFSLYLGKLVRAEALSAGSASSTQAQRDSKDQDSETNQPFSIS